MSNIYQKINQIMLEVESVHKGSTVKVAERSSYNAVSHDDVTALLHMPMAKAGIVAIPEMTEASMEPIESQSEYQGRITVKTAYRVKVWVQVKFVNMDDPQDYVFTKCFSYALDGGDKATGKAYSMAVKYCFLKTFMLESVDEEESRDFEKQYPKEPHYTIDSYNKMAPYEHKPKPRPTINLNDEPVSEQQKKAIFAISQKHGIMAPELKTVEEAKAWITSMNNKGK